MVHRSLEEHQVHCVGMASVVVIQIILQELLNPSPIRHLQCNIDKQCVCRVCGWCDDTSLLSQCLARVTGACGNTCQRSFSFGTPPHSGAPGCQGLA